MCFKYRTNQQLPMSDDNNQSNPAELFKKWMEQSGKNQQQFYDVMSEIMSKSNPKFDPSNYYEMAKNYFQQSQDNLKNMFPNLQNDAQNMLNFTKFMPNFTQWASYKTSVGSNGRISIPEAERDALDISEGDLVQVFILPVKKKKE